MNNLEKYNNVFAETFDVAVDELNGLKYQDIPAWDSIGHMSLVVALEETFKITLDTDDIIDMSSFEKGKETLVKYDIIF